MTVIESVWIGKRCGIITPNASEDHEEVYSIGALEPCVLCTDETCMAEVRVVDRGLLNMINLQAVELVYLRTRMAGRS